MFSSVGILRTDLTCANWMRVIWKLSCSSRSHWKRIQRRHRRCAQASRIPSASCEWGVRWKISPQWTTHRQSSAYTALPFFVSLCFNQGHSTVSSNEKKNPKRKKKKPFTNAHQAQKCQDHRKMDGENPLRRYLKYSVHIKKFPFFLSSLKLPLARSAPA